MSQAIFSHSFSVLGEKLFNNLNKKKNWVRLIICEDRMLQEQEGLKVCDLNLFIVSLLKE